MTLVILAYLAGVLTIVSPCILPILPFVFSRSQSSFSKHGLPLLLGMSLTFSAVSLFALAAGSWIAKVNGLGRGAAMVLLVLFGLSLLVPELSRRVWEPFSRLGNKLYKPRDGENVWSSLLFGASTGLLWAPCAGPILGLVLTGAAAQENRVLAFAMLLAYSMGAATSLALALLAGQRVFASLKMSLAYDRIVKRVLGLAVIASVLFMAMRWDRSLLTQVSKANTEALETKLLELFHAEPKADESMMMSSKTEKADVKIGPSLAGAQGWINSPALDLESLKGKVVLIDFWTYSCINCLRTLPYLKAWHDRYKDQGLVIVGVHTPEFAFEHERSNVEEAVRDFGLDYPIAIDNDFAIWSSFKNKYWPAHYFLDREGKIRATHFGEGNYEESEQMIRSLLAENGQTEAKQDFVPVKAAGVSAAHADDIQSPETYLGYVRTENVLSNPRPVPGQGVDYKPAGDLGLNQWSIDGRWIFGPESVKSDARSGRITFRFHARDLHLVLGSAGEQGVRFRVTIDGKVPGKNHGVDIDADGLGVVKGHRLYQLIRQSENEISDREFEIEFLDPGVEAFAFTFG